MKVYRKERFKLVKDLEEGENTLCQKLLDISEFDNINDAFEKRKLVFKIQKRQVTLKPYVPVSQDAKQYDMTPTQKLDLYKKKKIKEKFNQNFLSNSSASIQMLKKMFKTRKSKIPSMLTDLNDTMKKQVLQQFDKQMKRSEEKLKIFRSQGKIHQEKFSIKNQHTNNNFNGNQNRCKFYSLKTGKPQMNQKLFPTFEEYVDGKNRAKLKQKYFFDVSKIEKEIRTFYTQIEGQNPEENLQNQRNQTKAASSTGRLSKAQSVISQKHFETRGIMSERNPKCITSSLKRNFRINQKIIQRYSQSQIEKSQLSSSKLVKTMNGFYKSKNNKKSQYNNMVSFYDHDRPLTNSIRRQKYQFVSATAKIKPLSHYRHKCQAERQEILHFNSITYKNILKVLERYHEDDIPVSIEILRSVRQLMKKQYVFGEEQVRKVLRQLKCKFDSFFKAQKQTEFEEKENKEDFMIQPVIDVLNKAYGFNILWIDA